MTDEEEQQMEVRKLPVWGKLDRHGIVLASNGDHDFQYSC